MKKRTGAYCKNKGSNFERKIVKELNEQGFNVATTRAESKSMDDKKIDIFDKDGTLPMYIQLKRSQSTPSIKKLNEEVGLKDKPLCVIWDIQEKREVNCVSIGEYAIIPKSLLYEFLNYYKICKKI